MANPLRILLLEDSPLDAELAERQLRRGGLEPTIKRVTSEARFRSEVVSGDFDLIVADYHLPDFNGVKALEIAHELAPDIPFIFMSGSIGEERAIEALRHGASDYIIKDRPQRLSAAVRSALEQRSEREARRRMQDALIESEQRFHFVAIATRDVIWDWHIEAGAMWVNDALRSEWGWDFEDNGVDYAAWSDKIHPDDLERVTESLQHAIEAGDERWSAEYRFRRADRTYGFVFDRRVIIRRPNRRAMRIIGAMQDVTERKIFEQRALDAERLAHLGTFSRERVNNRRQWSDEMYRIFGYPPGETITDEKVLARVHPDDRDMFVKVTEDPESLVEFSLRITPPRGTRVIDVRLVADRDEHGTLLRMFGTAQDITERVKTESRIVELSRINSLILENAAEGILALSDAETLMFANPSARRMLGWQAELTALPHPLLHPDETDERECPFLADIRVRAPRAGETTFATRDGHHLDVRYTSAPILESGEVIGAVVTFVDISERKLLERQLAQVNRVSGLGRVAATIAHEFNNVLMGIQPFTEIIQRRSDDQIVKKAASQIATSVLRGKRVTEEILRFTQPSDPSRQPIVINEWLRNLIPELQGLVGQRVEIVLRLSDGVSSISGDPHQLQQVMTNLVLNARDAIVGSGVITISLRVDTSTEEFWFGRIPPGLLLITVEDTGGGMEPDVLRQIFDPLVTTKRTGTGLGLAVAQQVITRHGGSIHADSMVGKGTTFYILLPTSQPIVAPIESPRSHDGINVRRVLLVEDEVAISSGVAMLLETEGVNVMIVERGSEVMDAIARFNPDVVVLDISLPDTDGPTVYQRIAASHPSLPVLFSSGHADESAVAKYVTTDHVRFLRKPYDFDDLVTAIEKITRNRRPD